MVSIDGKHPGKDLVLLDATLLYRHLTGSDPAAGDFIADAPSYASNSGLAAKLRAADDPPPQAGTPQGASYTAATIEKLLAVTNRRERTNGDPARQP